MGALASRYIGRVSTMSEANLQKQFQREFRRMNFAFQIGISLFLLAIGLLISLLLHSNQPSVQERTIRVLIPAALGGILFIGPLLKFFRSRADCLCPIGDIGTVEYENVVQLEEKSAKARAGRIAALLNARTLRRFDLQIMRKLCQQENT